MSGGSFDHNLAGIADGQGVEWDDTAHELVPTDLVRELEDLLDVTGTASPTKGGLLVGDGTTWQVLSVGDDGQRLTPESTDPLGVEWVDAATGGGGGAISVEDDDVTVVAAASILNFELGLDVVDEGSGKATVNSSNLRGEASIDDPDTFVDVSHGLGAAPSAGEIQVTPTASLGTASFWWISDVNSSTFRINIDAAAGATVTFGWLYAAATEANPFSPLSIGWHTAFWTEGSNFVAQGYSDTDPVGTWPDESGNGRDATQGTASQQPLFVASDGNFSGRPTIHFDGSNDWLATAAFAADITGVSEHFIVARLDATGSSMAFQHSIDAAKRRTVQAGGGGNWQIFQGTILSGGATDTVAHAFRAVFDSTDELFVDGTSVLSGDAGTENLSGVRLGANAGGSGSFLSGRIAFCGIKDGTLTAQERADLLQWAQDHYGIP